MRIFIDESGSFQIPDAATSQAAAVVVGIIVPEVSEAALFGKYAEFVEALDSSEFKESEPKGSRLSRESRKRFCEVLYATPGTLIIPTTADLSDLAGEGEKLPARLSRSLSDFACKCVHQTMRDEIALVASQAANLSTSVLLKLLLYSECIQECIHHAVAYRSAPPYRDCWSKVDIMIDRVQKSPDSREKQVFDLMLLSWLTAWSRKRPLMLITEVHTPDHPFVLRYETGTGINMRRLIGDGFRWVDSKAEPGIQLADIAANIVFGAVHDLTNREGRHSEFLSLMRCCPLAARDGPGLVTLLPHGQISQPDKYHELVLALEARFPERAGGFRGLRQPPSWALSGSSTDQSAAHHR